MDTSSSPVQGTRRLWTIIVAIVLFAFLMALRYELESVWARAAIAACAFLILGWGVFVWRRRRT